MVGDLKILFNRLDTMAKNNRKGTIRVSLALVLQMVPIVQLSVTLLFPHFCSDLDEILDSCMSDRLYLSKAY